MRSLASYCIVVLTRLSAIHIVISQAVHLILVFGGERKRVFVVRVKEEFCQRTANKEYQNLNGNFVICVILRKVFVTNNQ